jgi:hypothetical protein
LANSTVNHSQIFICSEKPRLPLPVTRSRRNRTVVSVETTATTNITGFLASVRGSSLTKAEPIAGMRMRESIRLADLDWLIRELQFLLCVTSR